MKPDKTQWSLLLAMVTHRFQLSPEQFWKLTPLELNRLFTTSPKLSRNDLNKLMNTYPDAQ